MEHIRDGWFAERSPLWPGQSLSLQVKQVLHHEKSSFQDILIVETAAHGTALILDGIVQCTERDEFSYQEMISMLPLCAHPLPERVLIVGGGDGGVAREVVKHPSVRSVHQVEIDERVVQLSRKYLPDMACGFNSPLVTLHIGDGFDYLARHAAEFDVVITDSSDPVGPNCSLFQEAFFGLVRGALRPGGLVCCQAGAPWLELPAIRRHMDACRRHFPVVRYALASVPTYPTGQIGLMVGSSHQERDPAEPVGPTVPGLRYYDSAVHRASFVLPGFVRAELST